MEENQISYLIRKAGFKVHNNIGPGVYESVYEAALAYELRKLGLKVETQVAVPMVYDMLKFDVGFRLDILVEGKIIVEVKSVEELANVHKKQLLTYLKLTSLKLGLLINFNEESLKVVRVVNGL